METVKKYGTVASDIVYSPLNGMELEAKAEQMSSNLYTGFFSDARLCRIEEVA
jgi:hypothetical protein